MRDELHYGLSGMAIINSRGLFAMLQSMGLFSCGL